MFASYVSGPFLPPPVLATFQVPEIVLANSGVGIWSVERDTVKHHSSEWRIQEREVENQRRISCWRNC